MGGGWLTPCPSRFTRMKYIQYPLYTRLGGTQGLSGRVQKISPPLGSQPVASRYICYSILAHFGMYTYLNSNCNLTDKQ